MPNETRKEKHSMKSFKHCKEVDGKLSEDILKLLKSIMSQEEGDHVSFDRVNVEGSNVGAVMNLRQSKPKELPDSCSINVYVSNNVQGVNNSILVGSEVKMGDPGLGISFGDVAWERVKSSRVDMSTVFHKFGFSAVFLCVFLLLVSLLLPLLNGGKS